MTAAAWGSGRWVKVDAFLERITTELAEAADVRTAAKKINPIKAVLKERGER